MLSIPETLHAQSDAAVHKAEGLAAPGRFLISGMLAGAYIGIGVVLMVSVAGPLAASGDGLTKLVSGAVFGCALTMTIFGTVDLATSAMMQLPVAIFMRALKLSRASAALGFIFVANFIGSAVFAGLIVASGVLHSNAPAGAMIADILAAKAHEGPIELFTRGILCNVLVCLAIFMGMRVQSEVARIILTFIAITPFVSSGFEHVIANMTTYVIGFLTSDPNATLIAFSSNMLWVGLGNLVGGGAIVGLGYWLIGNSPRVPTTQSELSGTHA